VLIVVDALRADRLGCYGYDGATSPFLDSLASAGVLGESFFTSSIPEYSAFASLLSGVHPLGHEVLSNDTVAEFPDEFQLAPEIFIKSGYTTCGVSSLRHERPWFGRGLEFSLNPAPMRARSEQTTARELNALAIQWISSHVNEPFFFFIHYREPRAALAKGAGYDDAVRAVDAGIRQLVTAIDNLRMAPRTLIAVTADRGASLGEHGIANEARGLYEPTLRIPFIARWPEHIVPGTRLKGMWQSEDIAPTLFEALEMEVSSSMEGPRFWTSISGGGTAPGRDRVISLDCAAGHSWAIRTSQYKLILSEGPKRELYDLDADPLEQHNLAARMPELAAELENELQAWVTRRIGELYRYESPFSEGILQLTATS
jgi:arylsulfatase A-like enzyme